MYIFVSRKQTKAQKHPGWSWMHLEQKQFVQKQVGQQQINSKLNIFFHCFFPVLALWLHYNVDSYAFMCFQVYVYVTDSVVVCLCFIVFALLIYFQWNVLFSLLFIVMKICSLGVLSSNTLLLDILLVLMNLLLLSFSLFQFMYLFKTQDAYFGSTN